jgi:hypothetical protein
LSKILDQAFRAISISKSMAVKSTARDDAPNNRSESHNHHQLSKRARDDPAQGYFQALGSMT